MGEDGFPEEALRGEDRGLGREEAGQRVEHAPAALLGRARGCGLLRPEHSISEHATAEAFYERFSLIRRLSLRFFEKLLKLLG